MYLVDEKPWKELLRILLSTALLYEVLWKWDLGFFFIFLCPFTIMSEVFESRRFLACLQSKTPMRLLCSSRAVSVWPPCNQHLLEAKFCTLQYIMDSKYQARSFYCKTNKNMDTRNIFGMLLCVARKIQMGVGKLNCKL